MEYQPGERDMILMQTKIDVKLKNGKKVEFDSGFDLRPLFLCFFFFYINAITSKISLRL